MIEDKLHAVLHDEIDRLPSSDFVDYSVVRRARRRVAFSAGALSLVLVVLIGAVGWVAMQDRAEPLPARQAQQPTWERVPSAPIDGRMGHVAVSAGTAMIVWGGGDGSEDPAGLVDGASFDYESRAWRPIAESLLETSAGRSGVWTGDEMLIWGGEDGDGSHGRPDNGAAYDPSSDTWRELSPSPHWSLASHSAVWTGTEMIVWGGVGGWGHGAAFDPVSDTWDALPLGEPRSSHGAVWTGTEMIVWGGADDSGRELATGATYDPSSDSWRDLPLGPLSARRSPTSVWTGTEMIVWGGWNEDEGSRFDGAAYNPEKDTWREIPRSPISGGLPDSPGAWNGQQLIVVGAGGDVAMYSPTDNIWTTLPDPPSGKVISPTLVSEGNEVVLWGGADATALRNRADKSDNSLSSEGARLRMSEAPEEAEVDEEQSEQPEGLVEEISEQTRAEIFAFRALAATGLMDPYGKRSYNWTYADDTSPTENGWRVGFAASDCAPRDGGFTCRGLSGEDAELGNALTDTFLVVAIRENAWRVVDVEGNILDDERGRVIGHSLPDTDEPSHWDFASTGTWPSVDGVHFSITPIWVGSYPTDAPGSLCEIQPVDTEGRPVLQPMIRYFEPPNRPFERGGWVFGSGFQPAEDVTDVVVTCRQRSGPGWEVTSDPQLAGEPGAALGATAEITWRGPEGFTSPAQCRATLVDAGGEVAWEGSARVEQYSRPDELGDYPYVEEAFVHTRGEKVDAYAVKEFECQSL